MSSYVMKIAAHSVGENGAKKANTGTSRSLEIPNRPTPEKKNGVEKSTAVARTDRIYGTSSSSLWANWAMVQFHMYRDGGKADVCCPGDQSTHQPVPLPPAIPEPKVAIGDEEKVNLKLELPGNG